MKSDKAAPKSLTKISIVKPVREAAMLTKIALHSRWTDKTAQNRALETV